MSRFESYINKDDIIKELIDECSEYLSMVKKGDGNFLYRGFKITPVLKKGILKKVPRRDRVPRHINKELHKHLGEYSKKLFGWNTRSEGVFCTSRYGARGYGNPYAVVPINGFKYIVGNNIDMYRIFVKSEKEMEIEGLKRASEIILRKNYKDKGLEKYLKDMSSYWECIVKCNSYYIIDEWKVKEIKEELL